TKPVVGQKCGTPTAPGTCVKLNSCAAPGGVLNGTCNDTSTNTPVLDCCQDQNYTKTAPASTASVQAASIGIGNGNGENPNPVDKQKSATINGYNNSNNSKSFSGSGILTYDPTTG